jgi:predicted ester cyclase
LDHRSDLSPAEVVTRLTDAFNAGDFDLAMSYVADDAVNHGPPATASLREWRAGWEATRAGFPDIHAEVEHIVEQGDTACRRLRLSGTSAGGPIPAGARFDVVGLDMVRVRNGQVVEHWALGDSATMAAQLGTPDA